MADNDDKLTADVASALALLKKIQVQLTEAGKVSESVNAELLSTMQQIQQADVSPPNFHNLGWAKEAKKGGADPKIVAALDNFEKKGDRKSAEEAVRVIAKDKKFESIAGKIRGILVEDEKQEQTLKKIHGSVMSLDAESKHMESAIDGLIKNLKA
jgi:hypothetical protein